MFENLISKHILLFFAGIFIAACSIELCLWMWLPVADQLIWLNDATTVASGVQLTALNTTYPHPGTTVLFPMAGFIRAGVSGAEAVQLVMAVFVAVFATLSAFVAYRLRPDSLWWLALLASMLLDLRLIHATPPSAAAAVVSVLLFLLFWFVQEKDSGTPALVYLGLCAGILASTRIDTAAFMCTLALPFLIYKISWRIYIPALVALLAFIATNPHTWVGPISYAMSVPTMMHYNESLAGASTFMPFFATFPFAILSIILYLYLFLEKKLPIPKPILYWLVIATGLFTALLASLQFHPLRYYLPLYILWDVLLPLGIIALVPSVKLYVPAITKRKAEWITIAFIILIAAVRIGLLIVADTREIII